MIISTVQLDGKPRYYIQEPTGGATPNTLCFFDSLATAGIVMRYLKGSTMRTSDQEIALQAMQDYDAKYGQRKGKKDAVTASE